MSAALLAATAACSAGESVASEPDTESKASAEFTARAADAVAELKAEQSATPPTEGPAAVPGQRVAFITITEAESASVALLNGLQSAATALGWEHKTYNANGNQSDANRFLQQAVTTKPDAIVVLGLNDTQTGSGLAAAQAAGIPVGCLSCWAEGQPDSRGPYAAISPSPSAFEQMGYVNAAYAYDKTGGSPKFLTFNDTSLSNLNARQAGFDRFINECTDAGGSCEVVANQEFQAANLTTTLAGQAAAAAQANREFNAVWASFDGAAQYVTIGLRQAGLANDSTFLVSANGDPTSVQTIKEDGYQRITVSLGMQWTSWALMDDLNRALANQPPVEQNVPIRLFDSTNIDSAEGWEGDVDFKSYYTRVWAGA
ncbi:substrate-binding domain-containing protein [Rhodococcus sp. USK13]|uniref:sugar ABC transporter substrate-binding protein n=1 Tax=Rhodococcus sp. USK13 TaxID=2806442 RepID=UPI001BCD62CC|nr:substrate-binding domain-containing protein [Rhodococcus sp. USK13]